MLPVGEVGEVCVRGDVVMAGYWRNPEATATALRDGWLFTGDVGACDGDGFLTLKDRSKDLIISGGSNIYPREVEEVLLHAPGVAEVAVVGAPMANGARRWWPSWCARCGTRGGASSTRSAWRTSHASSGRSEYRFVARLPKNHYGKVVKAELRAALAAGGADVRG